MKKLMKIMVALMCIFSTFLMGCSNLKTKTETNEKAKIAESTESLSNGTRELPVATIEVEGYGTIQAELYPEIAPNTVNNFIYLANNGFYNNLTFHRVIKDFMIQGGDPKGNGTGGPGYYIEGEFTSNGFANALKHTEGVLSMARAENPDSAGSQFFIMTSDRSDLDGKYAAFGKVISGMEVVKKIAEVKTDFSNNKPDKDVIIKSITVDTKGIDYQEPIKK